MNDSSVFKHETLPQQQGFTLIEMTMVLIILSLLLGGLMTPLSNQLEKNHRQETKRVPPHLTVDDISSAWWRFFVTQ